MVSAGGVFARRVLRSGALASSLEAIDPESSDFSGLNFLSSESFHKTGEFF